MMRGALAICVPSVAARSGDSEGLPNVVLEAMASAVPVIGSEIAGITEAVEDGRTGFLIPPADPRAIASAIRRLLGDPVLRRSMGGAGAESGGRAFQRGCAIPAAWSMPCSRSATARQRDHH